MYELITINCIEASNGAISRLFHLEPQGIGILAVESLSSYISRLALEHSIKFGKLFDQEILPHMNGQYSSKFFFGKPHIVNSVSQATLKLVNALTKQTLRTDLGFLTLLKWNSIMDPQYLTKRSQAWCPHCYQQWLDNGETVYQPLIWYLEDIEICPHHLTKLVTECPDCGRQIPILSRLSIPGYCPRCNAWLGSYKTQPNDLTKKQMEWQLWVINNISDLFIDAPKSDTKITKETLLENMVLLVKHLTDGNIGKFSRESGLPRKYFYNWLFHNTLPCFKNLLRFCYCTSMSLLNICTKPFNKDDLQKAKIVKIGNYTRAKHRIVDDELLKTELEKVINSKEEPISVADIIRNYGYSRVTIQKHFPDLYRKAIDNYQQNIKRIWAETRNNRLQEVRNATIQLYEQGNYPSAQQVRSLLSPGHDLFRRDSFETWKDTLKELQQAHKISA